MFSSGVTTIQMTQPLGFFHQLKTDAGASGLAVHHHRLELNVSDHLTSAYYQIVATGIILTAQHLHICDSKLPETAERVPDKHVLDDPLP